MKKDVIPDINKIIKIIIICFFVMLLVINFARFSLEASLVGGVLFVIFITPPFMILYQNYLNTLEKAFCKNTAIPSNLINKYIAFNFLKKQLKSNNSFRIIKALTIFEELKKPVPKKIYQDLITNKEFIPYLLKTLPVSDDNIENIIHYLDDENLAVKMTAIEIILTCGNDNQKELAATYVKSLITADDLKQKAAGAEIIAKTKKTEFFEQIVGLFDNENISIKRLALITAGKSGDESFIPHILNALKNNKLSSAANKALADLAPKMTYETFNEVFNQIPYKNKTTFLKRLVYNKSNLIIKALIDNLADADLLTKKAIINCLFDMNIVADDETYSKIKSCLYDLNNHATWLLSAISDISTNIEISELKRVLKYEFDVTKEAVFRILPVFIPAAKPYISFSNDEKLEKNFCETKKLAEVLPEEIRVTCMPLIEHLSLKEKAIRLKPHFSQNSTSFENRLVEIFTAPANKTLDIVRAHAVLVAGKFTSPIFLENFKKALSDDSYVVRKTSEYIISEASKQL